MLSSVVYPSGQEIHIDPYNGKLFDFNSHQSRVYLGRSINSLLKVFGDNCIIDGLKLVNVTLEHNILTCTINPGKIIIDTTLIEFPSPIILETDVTTIDDSSGFFIITIAFNYLQDKYDNYAKFRLLFVDKHGNSKEFFSELDRIILTKIEMNKSRDEVVFTPSYYSNSTEVTINSTNYKVFPADNVTKNIIQSIREIFFL